MYIGVIGNKYFLNYVPLLHALFFSHPRVSFTAAGGRDIASASRVLLDQG